MFTRDTMKNYVLYRNGINVIVNNNFVRIITKLTTRGHLSAFKIHNADSF